MGPRPTPSTAAPAALAALVALALLAGARGHGTMVFPAPRQPESVYWYQVGCLIGCECSGNGKENYPTDESLGCATPAAATTRPEKLTWNVAGQSPHKAKGGGHWNAHMPWRAPGQARVLDSCGIASGFKPDAKVQFPHKFAGGVKQGTKGTELEWGARVAPTVWRAGAIQEVAFSLIVNHGGGYQYRVCEADGALDEGCFAANVLPFVDAKHVVRRQDGTEVQIPAVDVTEGVTPAGKAWRRLPIPACNCDFGADCAAAGAAPGGKDDAGTEYRTAYSADAKPYGDCETGLQFYPKHLEDGLWPEGYGYFVGSLGPGSKRGYGKDRCAEYKTKVSCDAYAQDGCTWFAGDAGKGATCYKGDGKGGGKGECAALADPTSCGKVAGCTWYAPKKQCYGSPEPGKGGDEPGKGGDCGALADSDSCAKVAGCTWYADKKVCYGSPEPGKGGDKPGGDEGKGCYSYTTETACEAAAPEQHCKWFPGDPSSGKEALCGSDEPMPVPPPSGKKRILALHGGGGSARGFSQQLGVKDLQEELSDFDLVFASSPEAGGVWIRSPPGGKSVPTSDPHWADTTIKFLDKFVDDHGPFDSILGYSQGGALIPIYLANTKHTFNRVMMYCSYLESLHHGLMAEVDAAAPIATPSMVFSGEKDTAFGPLAPFLAAKFKDPVAIHSPDAGHALPLKDDPTFASIAAFIRGGAAPAPVAGPASPTGRRLRADFSGAGAKVINGKDPEWVIVDEVIAPRRPGKYVLQWRWDNEQTPQVWTTCADVEVLPAQAGAQKSRDSGAAAVGRALAAAAAFLVAAVVA